MCVRQFSALLGVVALGVSILPGLAQADVSTKDPLERCRALGNVDFSRVLDAPTQVNKTKWVEASGGTPSFCEVSGYVAPSVGFELRLPAYNWNEKFLELGCGGLCGTTTHIRLCDGPLRRGYACIVTDDGHRGEGVLWIYNNSQAQVDLAYRATHVTALAGRSIVERYYDQAPRRNYFVGCSAGGREAMMEAQRFPWDFNGIVAGCPSLAPPRNLLSYFWANRVITDRSLDPRLGQAELDMLHRAVVANCDMNDGITDGLIGDPRRCDFDPSTLLCNSTRPTQCLTPMQVEVVKKLYGPPVNSRGEPLNLPFAMKGSERLWLDWFGSSSIGSQSRVFFQPDPGADWVPEDFDFDRDPRRLGMADAIISALNPDLRQFKAAGGKLLSYSGWNDLSMQLGTVDYYETVERTMGGRTATQGFFRLFMVPGMAHCGGGEGANDFDYLSYLEAWVEKGEAPDRIIGAHVDADQFLKTHDPNSESFAAEFERFRTDPHNRTFVRPVYPYPYWAKYKGFGDPNDAANFVPAK